MVSVTVCARRGEGKNYFRKKKTTFAKKPFSLQAGWRSLLVSKTFPIVLEGAL